MKKAVITGEGQARLVDVPDPKAKEDWVLVKVHASPMCAEYKAFVSGHKEQHLGHEAAGEVVAVAQPCHRQVGDRVVAMPLHACGKCSYCLSGNYIVCLNRPPYEKIHGSLDGVATMAQYILKQSWLLCPIPEGVSYERGSLACCALGPSFGAFQSMNLNAHDTVLITGLGPVGLGAVVNARFRGARVIAVDTVPWRVKRAEKMGAAVIAIPAGPEALDAVRKLAGGDGVDAALDCAGHADTERLCIDAARPFARVAFIGECGNDLKINVSPDLIRKNLFVQGSWHYNLADYPKVMQVIRQSPLIDLLLSHVVPMSRIQEAFELSASHECAKVVLKPWE